MVGANGNGILENRGVFAGVELETGFCLGVECDFLPKFIFNGISSSSSLLSSFDFFGIFNIELKIWVIGKTIVLGVRK